MIWGKERERDRTGETAGKEPQGLGGTGSLTLGFKGSRPAKIHYPEASGLRPTRLCTLHFDILICSLTIAWFYFLNLRTMAFKP